MSELLGRNEHTWCSVEMQIPHTCPYKGKWVSIWFCFQVFLKYPLQTSNYSRKTKSWKMIRPYKTMGWHRILPKLSVLAL